MVIGAESNSKTFELYCGKTCGDHHLTAFILFTKTLSPRMHSYAESQGGVLPNARGHELANLAQ